MERLMLLDAQPHLSAYFALWDAAHDAGPARQRRVRFLEHRPARLPGHAAGPCPVCFDCRSLVPARPLRRLQGHPAPDPRRPARPVPDRPRDPRRFGIPIYELAGFEADDLIGSLTLQAERRGLESIIVSGDLDMLQLVTDHTKLMTTRSGVQSTVIYDPRASTSATAWGPAR